MVPARRIAGIVVSSRAACPIARLSDLGKAQAAPSRTRMVVGADNHGRSSAEVIDYALEAASERPGGLTAVHAWTS